MGEGHPIRAGVARRDITPRRPELLQPSGMVRTERTRGVLDPLYVGALALEVGGEAAVILTSDLRRVWYDWMDEARQRIADHVGCDPRRVLFSAVHNHSSSPIAADDSAEARATLAEAERRIVDGFVEAATEAWSSRLPAEIAATSARLSQPVGLNRRVRLSSGTCVNCWHGGGVCATGQKFVGPGGPHSDVVAVLAAREPGAAEPFALLASYATHPHLWGLPYFSGELPGGIRRAVEALVPGATVLHANSTGGDVDLHAVHPVPPDADTEALVEWFRSSADLLGRRVAEAVVPAVRAVSDWRPSVRLRHRYWSENEGAGISAPVTIVNAIALDDIAVVSLPGEMFHVYGLRLLAESPFAETVLVGYNGSNNAYLAPPEAFEQGSYEVMRGYAAPGEVRPMPCGRRVVPERDAAERVAERVLDLLAQLHGG